MEGGGGALASIWRGPEVEDVAEEGGARLREEKFEQKYLAKKNRFFALSTVSP